MFKDIIEDLNRLKNKKIDIIKIYTNNEQNDESIIMSNNLYEEAINAADQIKAAAESRVKQQLVEAMSPKIKQLIESNIMDSVEESYLENTNEYGESIEEVEPSECGEGVEEVDMKEDPAECGEGVEEEKHVEISAESVKILKKMVGQSQKKKAIVEKLDAIREGINRLKKAMILAEGNKNSNKIKRKFLFAYQNLLKELKNIKSSSIIKTDKTILKEFLQLSKELNNMSRRRSRSRYLNENLEDLLEMNLFEEDEEMPEDDMGDEQEPSLSDDDEGEELQLDSPADSDSVELGPLEDMSFREVVDAALEGMGGGDEMEEPDLEEEGVDEGIFYEVDEMETCGPDELAEMEEEGLEGEEPKEEMAEGLFLEIDENMLKREINNMRRLREGEASDMAHHFGGGSKDKEMFTEFDESDLNVHADHLGREGVPVPTVEAALRNAVRKNRIAESRNKQYRNALRGMKKQLSEMNLFNAKLLYANKLMQNRDLSIKQQKHIVESLDEAGTLNEAKLLFESLSKSLSRPTRKGGNLNESANRRVLGSSSRSVRSAQPMNESVALDRWATLAGIKK